MTPPDFQDTSSVSASLVMAAWNFFSHTPSSATLVLCAKEELQQGLMTVACL